jgi:glycosyltransferase involved in cell wall biosynthesis
VRISFVIAGLDHSTWRLQPWRYFWEIAQALSEQGHEVEIVSRRATTVPLGVNGRVTRVDIDSVRPAGLGSELGRHLVASRPEVIVWNVGATSALGSAPPRVKGATNVAVFTSPRYGLGALLRTGTVVLRRPRSYALHLAGAALPDRRVVAYLRNAFDHVVFSGPTSALDLVAAGLPASMTSVLPPGRDNDIAVPPRHSTQRAVSFLYAGSPTPIRGADILIRAFARVAAHDSTSRLVVLSRHERPELARDSGVLERLIDELRIGDRVDLIAGTLARPDFLRRLDMADVMVLPFRLVPSEAPLAVLEAAGAGKPLIASNWPAIADLAAPGSILVPAGDVAALARAMDELAADPDRRRSLAATARGSYETWPVWPEVARELAGVIGRANRDTQGGMAGPGLSREPLLIHPAEAA